MSADKDEPTPGLKLDLHVHTTASPDGFTSPEEALNRAEESGLDGLALTDHDYYDPERQKQLQASTELLVVPGQEVTSEQGHILAYFIESEIESFRPPWTIVDDIHRQGGLAVVAHPFRLMEDYPGAYFEQFDAIERFNARSGDPGRPGSSNYRTQQLMDQSFANGMTGGSDSHLPWTIGNGFTLARARKGLGSVKEAIRAGRTEAAGIPSYQFNRALSKARFLVKYPDRTFGDWVGYVFDCARWVGWDLKQVVNRVRG